MASHPGDKFRGIIRGINWEGSRGKVLAGSTAPIPCFPLSARTAALFKGLVGGFLASLGADHQPRLPSFFPLSTTALTWPAPCHQAVLLIRPAPALPSAGTLAWTLLRTKTASQERGR